MNALQVIEQREVLGKDFKVYGDINNPLFLARDVAEWIDYSKSGNGSYNVTKMLYTIDDSEKLTGTMVVAGQRREVTLLTEDGLYEVLMQSRKPIAKQFKSKVKEILKDIRKHGVYATEELLNNPDFLIKALTELKSERKQRAQLETQITNDRPKVIFADAVASSKDCVSINELAKLLKQNGMDIGQNRLFEKMRKEGYLCTRGETYNLPTQRAAEMGVFIVKEMTINAPDAAPTLRRQTLVTGKGINYFVNRYLNDKMTKTKATTSYAPHKSSENDWACLGQQIDMYTGDWA
jgi:anti-repressor protein